MNIRANGYAGRPGRVLAGLDWVVGSIHAALDDDTTERVMAAMENPHVDAIGHLTGRKINRRAPTESTSSGCSPRRSRPAPASRSTRSPTGSTCATPHARLAGEPGSRIVVSSDAHSDRGADYVALGIGQARRGWLTKEQIVNTRPWSKVKKLPTRR